MLVDSNIIIYALNKTSPKHEVAQKFLIDNQSKLFITQQNILESLRILTHSKFTYPLTTEQAINAVSGISNALPIIYPQFETTEIVLELIKKYKLKADQIFDAYLVATMLTNDIEVIATDNEKDFKKFTRIKVYNPFK